MSFEFKIIDTKDIEKVIPLVYKLNNQKTPVEILIQRFSEMITQNYECACIFEDDKIIGVTGLWYCTRHYSGRSVEVDHVYIDDDYRGQGLGKQFFEWIYNYTKSKGYETIELNAYVQSSATHKFYLNEEFKILGFHFLKKL